MVLENVKTKAPISEGSRQQSFVANIINFDFFDRLFFDRLFFDGLFFDGLFFDRLFVDRLFFDGLFLVNGFTFLDRLFFAHEKVFFLGSCSQTMQVIPGQW